MLSNGAIIILYLVGNLLYIVISPNVYWEQLCNSTVSPGTFSTNKTGMRQIIGMYSYELQI